MSDIFYRVETRTPEELIAYFSSPQAVHSRANRPAQGFLPAGSLGERG